MTKNIEEIDIVITSNSNTVTILKLLDYGIRKEPKVKIKQYADMK